MGHEVLVVWLFKKERAIYLAASEMVEIKVPSFFKIKPFYKPFSDTFLYIYLHHLIITCLFLS